MGPDPRVRCGLRSVAPQQHAVVPQIPRRRRTRHGLQRAIRPQWTVADAAGDGVVEVLRDRAGAFIGPPPCAAARGGEPDRVHDLLVAGAAAQVPGKRFRISGSLGSLLRSMRSCAATRSPACRIHIDSAGFRKGLLDRVEPSRRRRGLRPCARRGPPPGRPRPGRNTRAPRRDTPCRTRIRLVRRRSSNPEAEPLTQHVEQAFAFPDVVGFAFLPVDGHVHAHARPPRCSRTRPSRGCGGPVRTARACGRRRCPGRRRSATRPRRPAPRTGGAPSRTGPGGVQSSSPAMNSSAALARRGVGAAEPSPVPTRRCAGCRARRRRRPRSPSRCGSRPC